MRRAMDNLALESEDLEFKTIEDFRLKPNEDPDIV